MFSWERSIRAIIGDEAGTEEPLRLAEGGDDKARRLLPERHRDRLKRMIAVRLDPGMSARLDPSDVVQETMAEASRRLDDFLAEHPLPFLPWLRRLAGDRLVEAYRAHVLARKRALDREMPPGRALSDASTARLVLRLVETGAAPARWHSGRSGPGSPGQPWPGCPRTTGRCW